MSQRGVVSVLPEKAPVRASGMAPEQMDRIAVGGVSELLCKYGLMVRECAYLLLDLPGIFQSRL